MAEKIEKKEELEPEKSKLDAVIESGEIPQNLETTMQEEADQINKKVVEEEKEKEEVEGKGKEKKPAKPSKEEADEPIPEADRKKYGIPDNIKTKKAAYEWGPNAEKKMLEFKAEKEKTARLSSEAEKRLANIENTMGEFKKALKLDVKDGTISEEERLIEEEKMRLLWEKSPIEAVNKIIEEREKKAVAEAQKMTQKEQQEALVSALKERREMQFDELTKAKEKYTELGKDWDKEVLPAIHKIASERPHLVHFEEVEYFYLKQLKEQEEKIAAEEEAKRSEKIGAGSETSHKSADDGIGGDSKLAEAIDNFTGSQAELDKLAGLHKI
jgi:hypothetical protein